jgi:hypothetical protein
MHMHGLKKKKLIYSVVREAMIALSCLFLNRSYL